MATQQQPQQQANKWPLADNGRSPILEKIAAVLRGKVSESEITQLARKIESTAFSSASSMSDYVAKINGKLSEFNMSIV
ncbi:3269_t:CDS:2, partial [Paraglomus brasilianum]